MNEGHFPYAVADGHVALKYEEGYVEKDGIQEPHKKIKIRTAIVVAVGNSSKKSWDEISPMLVVGRKVLMPSVNKQEFRIDGTSYFVCHHNDIKVIDPADDTTLMLELLENHMNSLPKDVVSKFTQKFVGL